ncbi:hypothetical protein VCHA36P166_10455 [Vibrio chagasii]|nr:hypothetical protein VCHA36P166_10455 [Vibrio chagasii]
MIRKHDHYGYTAYPQPIFVYFASKYLFAGNVDIFDYQCIGTMIKQVGIFIVPTPFRTKSTQY